MFPEGRIFDFLIIGVLALIVVGPKDLPILMRRLGRFVAHMRSMAAEFRASFDEMARQSELDELRKEVEALRSGQTLQTAVGLGPDSGVHEVFNDIHAEMKPSTPVVESPPSSAPPIEPPMAAVPSMEHERVSSEPGPPALVHVREDSDAVRPTELPAQAARAAL
jgi:sec-independent protein translocase protein TatB